MNLQRTKQAREMCSWAEQQGWRVEGMRKNKIALRHSTGATARMPIHFNEPRAMDNAKAALRRAAGGQHA